MDGPSTPCFRRVSLENIWWIPGLGTRMLLPGSPPRRSGPRWRPDSAPRLFFSYVVTKDEAHFRDAANLVGVGARPAKGGTRRIAARVSPRNVAAKEQPAILKGGRRGERSARTSGAEQQVDRLIGGAPRGGEVFNARRKREAMLEGPAYQQRSAVCRSTVHNPNLGVGGHVT